MVQEEGRPWSMPSHFHDAKRSQAVQEAHSIAGSFPAQHGEPEAGGLERAGGIEGFLLPPPLTAPQVVLGLGTKSTSCLECQQPFHWSCSLVRDLKGPPADRWICASAILLEGPLNLTDGEVIATALPRHGQHQKKAEKS